MSVIPISLSAQKLCTNYDSHLIKHNKSSHSLLVFCLTLPLLPFPLPSVPDRLFSSPKVYPWVLWPTGWQSHTSVIRKVFPDLE